MKHRAMLRECGLSIKSPMGYKWTHHQELLLLFDLDLADVLRKHALVLRNERLLYNE